MVQKLMAVLQKVIAKTITSNEARDQLKSLLDKQEHSDLLQYVLRFVPSSPGTEVIGLDVEIRSEDEEQPPSERFSRESSELKMVGDDTSLNVEAGLEINPDVQNRPNPAKQQPNRSAFASQRYRRFSEEEKAQIMDGVRRFGMGSRNLWRRIVSSYRFNNRSAVDIKDAFRTMQRAAWKQKKVAMDQRTPSKRSALDFTPFQPADQDEGEPRLG